MPLVVVIRATPRFVKVIAAGPQGPAGPGGDYTLPVATASVLGGVKVGTGLEINGSGVLSVTAVPGGETNLSYSATSTSVTIANDNGDGFTILAASGTIAGVMTAAQFTKLDGIASGATFGATWGTNLGSIPAVISNTTASFTTALETKLNGISAGATVGADWSVNLSNIPTVVAGMTSQSAAAQSIGATAIANELTAGSKIGGLALEETAPTGASFSFAIWDQTDQFFSWYAPSAINALIGAQETLVSGDNIKTINGASVLGAGDLTVSGSSPTTTYGDRIFRGASADARLPLSGIFAVNDCVATGNSSQTGWSQDTQSGASVAYLASESGAYGIARVTLAITSDSRATIIYGNTTSNNGAAYFEGNVMAEVRFRMNALSVAGTKYTVNLFLGRGNLLGDAFGATALRIRGTHDANSGQWQFIADNTSDTTVDSATALASGVWTTLRITDNGTTAEAFINGTSIGTITTNRPTGGTCTVAINFQRIGTGAGTNTIDVDYVALVKP